MYPERIIIMIRSGFLHGIFVISIIRRIVKISKFFYTGYNFYNF
jgi:hypothetical protein